MRTNIYSNIKTFDELCMIGCDFILNKIKFHPFLIVDESKDNLYELVDEKYKFIKEYLYQYNLMGFYTVMSQPGSNYSIKIYPTYLDYKKSFDDHYKKKNDLNKDSNNNFGVKQRAEVEGFIKLDKGIKLYNLLKDDPRIKIILSNVCESYNNYDHNYNNNNISNCVINDDSNKQLNSSITINKYATLSYEKLSDGCVRFMEMEADKNELLRKEFQGSNRNLKLSQMYHVVRRYFVVRTYSLKKHIPNLSDTDIIGISIMDLEWDKNDYLWEKIYLCLKNIN